MLKTLSEDQDNSVPIYQADKEGEHGTIHTRTTKRPTCGAWLDAGTACGAAPPLQICAGQL